MPDIDGRYTGEYSQERAGFVYDYDCPCCGSKFTSTAPTLSEPTICHLCYAGKNESYRRRDVKRRRKASPNL